MDRVGKGIKATSQKCKSLAILAKFFFTQPVFRWALHALNVANPLFALDCHLLCRPGPLLLDPGHVRPQPHVVPRQGLNARLGGFQIGQH